MSVDNLNEVWPLELELWPRQHDLPPRWDGLSVEWGKWAHMPIICPPPKRERCGHCRSVTPQVMNLGRIWTDPAASPNVVSIGKARLKNGKHLAGILTAFRCPDCRHDRVIDSDGQGWDLDQTDYTDSGSQAVSDSRA